MVNIPEADPFNAFTPDVIGQYQQQRRNGTLGPNGQMMSPATNDPGAKARGNVYTLEDGTQVDELLPGEIGRESAALTPDGTRTTKGTKDNAFAGYQDFQGGGFGGARPLAEWAAQAKGDPTAFLRLLRDPRNVASGINAGDSGDGSTQGQFWTQLAEMGGFRDLTSAENRQKARAWFGGLSDEEKKGVENGTAYGTPFAQQLAAALVADENHIGGWNGYQFQRDPNSEAGKAYLKFLQANAPKPVETGGEGPPQVDANGNQIERPTDRYRPIGGQQAQGFGFGYQNPYAGYRPIQGAAPRSAIGSPGLNKLQTRPLSGGAY